MKTKNLIELRELDLTILSWIQTGSPINLIASTVFKNSKFPQQSLYHYIIKYINLGLVDKQSRGTYCITKDGKYFIKIMEKLNDWH